MTKLQPAFDRQGYPTSDTLQRIREWTYQQGYLNLLDFVKAGWEYPESVKTREVDTDVKTVQGPKREYAFYTMGWSGNEDLITALAENHVFWGMCWQMSERGGSYVFQVPLHNDREV